MDELAETDRLLEAASRPNSLVKQVGHVQITTTLQRDPNLIAELTQRRASIMQEIEDDFFKKMDDSPGSVIRRQEEQEEQELMLKEFSSIFHIKKYNSENAHENLKDLINMLEKIEQLEEQLEQQLEEQPLYRSKCLAEAMALAEVSKDSMEELEGMMGTLAGSTARRSLYPTKSNGRQEILTMIPKKRKEILELIAMYPVFDLFPVPELPTPQKTVDSDTYDFYCLDGSDHEYPSLNETLDTDEVGEDPEDALLKDTTKAMGSTSKVRFRL